MNCHGAQSVMHGYLDGELDPSVSLQYEQHAGECPACSQALADQQAMQTAMKADSLYFKAPANLRDRLRASVKKQSSAKSVRFSWRWVAAAACVVFCIGLGFFVAQFASTFSGHERLTYEVASAHIRSMQAKHIVDVEGPDNHVVKPWFNGKLDFAPSVPNLEKEGFPLVGGRLDYLNGRPVAALVYKRREHVINLFVWPSAATESTDFQRETRQGYHLVQWSKTGMNFWLVSDLDPTELRELAERLSSHK
jgi:anti-sigma factor RsiW